MILSGDAPRGLALRIVLIVVTAALALAPFLFPGAKALNVAEKICGFARPGQIDIVLSPAKIRLRKTSRCEGLMKSLMPASSQVS